MKTGHSTACRGVLRSIVLSLLLASLAGTLPAQRLADPQSSKVSVGDTVEFSFGPDQVRGVVESVDGRRVQVRFTYSGREQTRRLSTSFLQKVDPDAPPIRAFKKGDAVAFQWGAEQVTGEVSSPIGPDVIVSFTYDGVAEKFPIPRQQLTLLNGPDAKPGAPRIKVGDFVTGDEGPAQVVELDGAYAELRSADGRGTRGFTLITDLEILSDAPDITEPATAKAVAAKVVRTWTDITGKHSVTATFISADDRNVTLGRQKDGREVTLPIAKLSKADRMVLRALAGEAISFSMTNDLIVRGITVSRDNRYAAIHCVAKPFAVPKAQLLIVDLVQGQPQRTIELTPDKETRVWSISSSGEYAVLYGKRPEGPEYEYSLVRCDASGLKKLRSFKAELPGASVQATRWLDADTVFVGASTGRVRLLKIVDGEVEIAYSKSLKDVGHGVFAINSAGSKFALLDSSGDVAVYDLKTAKVTKTVSANGMIQRMAFSLDDACLLGLTHGSQCVAWDLQKNKLRGGSQDRVSITMLGSFHTRIMPLEDTLGIIAIGSSLRGDFDQAVLLDFATGTTTGIRGASVFCLGEQGVIWYPISNGLGKHALRSFPMTTAQSGVSVALPGY